MDKRVAVGSFITFWAIALQVHMMWLQRQDAFKQKFGGVPNIAETNANKSDQPQQESLAE